MHLLSACDIVSELDLIKHLEYEYIEDHPGAEQNRLIPVLSYVSNEKFIEVIERTREMGEGNIEAIEIVCGEGEGNLEKIKFGLKHRRIEYILEYASNGGVVRRHVDVMAPLSGM